MAFLVLPATLADIRAIYDVWFASFKGQLVLDLIYPGTDLDDEAFRKVHAEGTLEYWKGLTMEHTFKCVDTETGRVAGMATWQVYWRGRTAEERVRPWIRWLEGPQRERAEGFLGKLWEKREEWIGGRPHIYCHTVAVHPEYQGKGVGKKLVQWALDVSEELKLPIYLESTFKGVPLYERKGFKKLKEGVTFVPADTGLEKDIEGPLMARMPASAGGMTFEEWASGGDKKL